MVDIVERPERVQAAFEVWHQRPEPGPNASAMFEYIEYIEADNQSLRARIAELEAAIDSAEVKRGLTDNGNLWRFWAAKARDLADKIAGLEAERTPPVRPQVEDEAEILRRLSGGDTIVFSMDGDMAWFTKGDRAFVGDAIMSLREKGYLLRKNDVVDDEDDPRGIAYYDTISDAGHAHLRGSSGEGKRGFCPLHCAEMDRKALEERE